MQVGRVYDAACWLLAWEEPAIGDEEVIIPVVAECDDSFLSESRVPQVTDGMSPPRWRRRGIRRRPVPAGGGRGRGRDGNELSWLQGGIGTASRVVPDGHTLAVVVLANFGERDRLTVAGVAVGRLLPRDDGRAAQAGRVCIVVIGTDAPVDAAGVPACRQAGLGLARTGSYAHHGSGEIFLAFATGLRGDRDARPSGGPVRRDLDPYFAAVSETTEEAVINALLAARTVVGVPGTPARSAGAAVRELLAEHGRL
jgi:D-aminopeptidase